MNKPEETTTPTPAEAEDPEVRFAKFMAEPMPPFVPRAKRRKALRIEVSQRTFEAVKANPGELKLLAKDANGNAVVERPARRRITEAEAAAWNVRVRAEARTEAEQYRRRQDPGPSAPDQHWSQQRTWTGETLYRQDDGWRNPFVPHIYDVFDVLKEDER